MLWQLYKSVLLSIKILCNELLMRWEFLVNGLRVFIFWESAPKFWYNHLLLFLLQCNDISISIHGLCLVMWCTTDGGNWLFCLIHRCVAFHPDGHSLFSGAQDSMRVYGWEPVRCYDSFSLGWGKVADIAVSSNQLVSEPCILTSLFSQEWPRQNFSLQYQYNIKQTSNENNEKYKLGDYKLIQYQILHANITRIVW